MTPLLCFPGVLASPKSGKLADTLRKGSLRTVQMERVDIYLDIVMQQPLLLAPIALLAFAFLLVPAHRRLSVTLIVLVPWLTLARLPGLGTIQAAAKVGSVAAYALIAIAALTHPGPRRDIPAIVWLYVVLAVLSILYVLRVDERMLAIVLRMQWLAVTVAAITLVRTLVTWEDFKQFIDSLTWGCIIALALPISGLILFPTESFLRGVARFQPYGANSNQIGMLFALSVPLMTYMAMTTRRQSIRPLLILLVTGTIGMALITGSRQTMLAIVLVMTPVVFVLSKRPILTFSVLAIAGVGLVWLLSSVETAAMERFSSLESTRLDIWALYWGEIFPQRPIFGLLGTTGESYFKDTSLVGQHPHNAWFYLMYLGGASLALPMFLLSIYSVFSGWQIWKRRTLLGGDPFLYSLMLVLLVAMYIQGLFNQVVYWPTYSWSFLHVVLAGLFITLWSDIKEGRLSEALPSLEYLEAHERELEEFEDFSVPQPAA